MRIDSWAPLGAALVGAIFVVAALMKVAAPFSFYRHLARLDLKLGRLLRVIVPVAIGLEGGWGLALLVGLMPHLALPFTAAALVMLTGFTWWSVKSGKTEDCGCYGGFISPSIGQTVALNGLYLLLIAGAWAFLPQPSAVAMWKVATVVFGAILIGGTADYALRSEFRTGVALFTPSPLKAGRQWKPRWGGTTLPPGTSQIVSYLGPDCPYCKRWVRALNVIHESPALPPVTAILSSSRQTIDEFVRETGVRFPIATVSDAKMRRLAPSVPVTLLIEDDTIQEVWSGTLLSESFSNRFRAAFFPLNAANDSSG